MDIKIYFGYAKSKRYNQAIEALINRSGHKVFKNQDTNQNWHLVKIQENEIDFLAFFFQLTLGLGWKNIPSKYTEIKYDSENYQSILPPCFKDHGRIKKILHDNGYIRFLDNFGNFQYNEKRLPEPDKNYAEIRNAISKSQYKVALTKYYQKLGNKPFGDLHSELLYLKRISNIPLTGRDLMCFRTSSSIEDLINENLADFIKLVDIEIKDQMKIGGINLMEILSRDTPTIYDLTEWIKNDSKSAVRLDGNGNVSPRGYDLTVPGVCREGEVKKGRLFEIFPNPVLCSRKYIFKNSKIEKPWITVSPGQFEKKIRSKGLKVVQVLNCYLLKKVDQDLGTIVHSDMKKISFLWLNGFEYSGRSLRLGGITLYEVIRGQDKYAKVVDDMLFDSNPFIDSCLEILRLAEDRFRIKRGLPKIGEGWISETKLFNIVKAIFPDAIKHARPKWLGRQHLDIYIPSKSIAIEYHGKQHFEAVEFFGGETQLFSTQVRDKKKKLLCKKNKVKLIEWHYSLEISTINLRILLEDNKITLD